MMPNGTSPPPAACHATLTHIRSAIPARSPIHPLGVQQDANTDHLDARSVLVWQIVLCGRRKAPPIRQQPRHNAGRRLALQGVQIVQGVRGIPLVRVCPPHLPGLSGKGAQEPLPVLGASTVFPRVLTW